MNVVLHTYPCNVVRRMFYTLFHLFAPIQYDRVKKQMGLFLNKWMEYSSLDDVWMPSLHTFSLWSQQITTCLYQFIILSILQACTFWILADYSSLSHFLQGWSLGLKICLRFPLSLRPAWDRPSSAYVCMLAKVPSQDFCLQTPAPSRHVLLKQHVLTNTHGTLIFYSIPIFQFLQSMNLLFLSKFTS